MLERCRRGQWAVDDIDWSRKPRALDPEVEGHVVQYFTDMAQIELLAGALFEEQRRRTKDPVLEKIFETFVVDEERHSIAAERLARHFDVRRLRSYAPSSSLVRFRPRFLGALRHVSAEVANAYIVGGELLLDIALLRSIDDFVDDPTCHDVMRLINRDESRHVSVDYYMTEFYASPAWQAQCATEPRKTPTELARAAVAFSGMILTAKPFIRDVFVDPMTRVDPARRRMREAFKRMQLLGARPGVADRPFPTFLRYLQQMYVLSERHPLTHRLFGGLAERLVGVPGEYLEDLATVEEREVASRMTMDELAKDALAAKAN